MLVVDVDAGGGVFGNSRATVITGDEDNRFLKVGARDFYLLDTASSSPCPHCCCCVINGTAVSIGDTAVAFAASVVAIMQHIFRLLG